MRTLKEKRKDLVLQVEDLERKRETARRIMEARCLMLKDVFDRRSVDYDLRQKMLKEKISVIDANANSGLDEDDPDYFSKLVFKESEGAVPGDDDPGLIEAREKDQDERR